MRLPLSALRLPHQRVLLGRTKLAYVHLRNLLTDAKRDRTARVFAYVLVWLPEESLVLYVQEGEFATATVARGDGAFSDIALRDALNHIPSAAEFGEICFHEVPDEQLACMYAAQTQPPDEFPPSLKTTDGAAVLGHLLASTYDGLLEVTVAGAVNYVILRNGVVRRAYLVDGAGGLPLDQSVRRLWDGSDVVHVRRWPVPAPLPNQVQPALIDAYRAFMQGLVDRLKRDGHREAVETAEEIRRDLLVRYPGLEWMALGIPPRRDPVIDGPELARAIGSWARKLLWVTPFDEGKGPAELLGEITHERRHLFQSAGLFEHLPWDIP